MMSDMIKTCWTMQVRRAAVASALGLAVLAAIAPGSARAQEDEEEKTSIWNMDKKIIGGVMRGLGLRNGNETEIEYRERSPLVIPPSKDLPQPQKAGAGQTPAWPSDPDVKRRKAAAEKRKNVIYDPEGEERNLSPSELNQRGTTRPGSASAGTSDDIGEEGKNSSPSGLGYLGGLFSSFGGQKEERAAFDREPTRGRLTAPPTGYQTPSPAQPYGISPKKDTKVTPFDPGATPGSAGSR
jgi:hypothetical protein